MGYVIKNTVMRWCRVDNLAQVRDPKQIRALKQHDMLVQRQGIGIIVYLESDFSDFYMKHVMRQMSRPDPVLVKNLSEVLSASETRDLINQAIRISKEGTAGALESPIPQLTGARYDVRVWNPHKKSFMDAAPIKKQVFRFRDIIRPRSTKEIIKELKNKVPNNEADSLISIYQESFQSVPFRNPKTEELQYFPKMDYTIDYIWIIQKILLYRTDWHG